MNLLGFRFVMNIAQINKNPELEKCIWGRGDCES